MVIVSYAKIFPSLCIKILSHPLFCENFLIGLVPRMVNSVAIFYSLLINFIFCM